MTGADRTDYGAGGDFKPASADIEGMSKAYIYDSPLINK